jgi:hypothetical protein
MSPKSLLYICRDMSRFLHTHTTNPPSSVLPVLYALRGLERTNRTGERFLSPPNARHEQPPGREIAPQMMAFQETSVALSGLNLFPDSDKLFMS